MVPSMSAGSGSVSPSLPCVAGRLRLGPADAWANQLAPGRPVRGAKPECTLESGRWTLRVISRTRICLNEAPGAGRTASGSPPNGHSLATRRAYFEAGMLRQMNDMHGYRSPRRRGRPAGHGPRTGGALSRMRSGEEGISSRARFAGEEKPEELTMRIPVSEHGRDLLLIAG